MKITDIRENFLKAGDQRIVGLIDIMLIEANEQLIEATEVDPSLKAKPLLQNVLIFQHFATFLSGMRLMSNIPNHFEPEALKDIKKLIISLDLKLRKSA